MQSILRRIVNIILDFVESIVVAATIFVIIYKFAAQPHKVDGASMLPTFHEGEYIFSDKISYRLHEPQRGDVIVFKAPNNPDFDYIKRIIAIPEDTILIKGSDVFVNGVKQIEPYINNETYLTQGQFLKDGQEYKLKTGEFFVMGDNRIHSSDSRQWGVVPEKDIIGRVFFRYWPPNKFGTIINPDK